MAYTYTTEAQVKELLPASLPEDLTLPMFSKWITGASQEVDVEVGRDFKVELQSTGQKFKDHPKTPPVIVLVTTWLAASLAYGRLKEVYRVRREEMSDEEKYRTWAMKKLARIRTGEIDVFTPSARDPQVQSKMMMKV